MEKTPNQNNHQPVNPGEQLASANQPQSGDRPDQGTLPAADHYDPQGKSDRSSIPAGAPDRASRQADKRVFPAPDNIGAKHRNPVLAQPPEAFTGLTLGKPATVAAGVTAVLKSMEFSWSEAGVGRGTQALLKLNQKDGFDCSSCAWPDPDGHRSVVEFCENGAKATASDADSERADPVFFAKHSLVDLSRMTDRDLNNAGRLTHPLVLRPGATHYSLISWLDAFQLVADELNALESPNEALFYTSGKVPNEPA